MERILKKVVIAITGYGQKLLEPTGLETLLIDAFARSDISTTFFRYCWDVNLFGVAAFMKRLSKIWQGIKFILIGFSYGGGSVIRLATIFKTAKIHVEKLFISDAVSRPWRYWPSFSSVYGGAFALVIPKNVGKLYSWRQNKSFIRGSRIRLESATLTDWRINRWNIWEDHGRMDQLPEFRDAVLAAVTA